MSRVIILLFGALLLNVQTAVSQGPTYRRGRTMTPEEVKAWDTGIKVLTKENMGTLEEYNRKKAHEMLPEFTKAWNVGKNGK